MRKNFTLYPLIEAVSLRTYIHDTNKARDYHANGVKILKSFLAGATEHGQKLNDIFDSFKRAMSQPEHLGKQTNNADVTSTLRNILREIYGHERVDEIDRKISEVEKHLESLEKLINGMVGEDMSQSIADLGKSRRKLERETPKGIVQAKPSMENPKEDADKWQKSIPVEGTPEWDRWVAMRADHIGRQKQKAAARGDTSKGDDLHAATAFDTRAHLQQAHDEIKKYVNSGKDHKQFVWQKHFKDWRAHIGQAINEYYELKTKEDENFFKSIMPPKPKCGYM